MEDGYWHLWIFGGVFICLGIAGWFVFRYWKSKKDNVTEDDIMTMVDEGHEQGVLETREARMIRNIFELDEKQAGNVMTHRKHITALPGSMLLKDAARFVLREGNNTRYPVYGEDLDDIIGTIHMRDVLVHAESDREAAMELSKVPGVLREAHFIPETRNIDALFREMQSQKIHMEIVIDEYGQTAGIITMEDILEEIVGNILDEYDAEEEFILAQEDGFILNGLTPLDEAAEALKIEFPEEEKNSYDTIKGFLISRLDRIPREDEDSEVEYGGYLFKILSVENKMIRSVKATPSPENEEETQEE